MPSMETIFFWIGGSVVWSGGIALSFFVLFKLLEWLLWEMEGVLRFSASFVLYCKARKLRKTLRRRMEICPGSPRLERLQEKSGCESINELMERALEVYRKTVDCESWGGKVILQYECSSSQLPICAGSDDEEAVDDV